MTKKLKSLDLHTVRGVVTLRLVVVNEETRNNDKKEHKKNAENGNLILLLQQKPRKSDTDLSGLWTIRITKLFIVRASHRISQSFVRFGNLKFIYQN